jgi:RNA polymerase sigma-70 factor (ECF subfamily)
VSAPPDDDDGALVARALRGEDVAFTQLMRRHKAALARFVRRYVGDDDGAIEVTQETFVAAWRALGRFDGRRPFPVWLRAIALNKCRDRARRRRVRRLAFGDKDAESLEARRAADPSPSAETLLLDRQRRAALDRAIADLPAKLKEPLLLTVFEELSQQAAADLLGVSVKTVETRVHRARAKLAAWLRDRENLPGG